MVIAIMKDCQRTDAVGFNYSEDNYRNFVQNIQWLITDLKRLQLLVHVEAISVKKINLVHNNQAYRHYEQSDYGMTVLVG